MLQAIDFLHTEAYIAHTDIKADNVYFVAGKGSTTLFAQRLRRLKPIGRYDADSNRIVYQSVRFVDVLKQQEISLGRPLLGGFGQAALVTHERVPRRLVAPMEYRSPEAVLEMPWASGLDVWLFGQMVFSVFSRSPMFWPFDADGVWSIALHLAQIDALMGPPPPEFLGRSRQTERYWHADGMWKGVAAVYPEDMRLHLDEMVDVQDPFAKADLIDFLHCFLRWLPEERATAHQLLRHPYIQPAPAAVVAIEPTLVERPRPVHTGSMSKAAVTDEARPRKHSLRIQTGLLRRMSVR